HAVITRFDVDHGDFPRADSPALQPIDENVTHGAAGETHETRSVVPGLVGASPLAAVISHTPLQSQRNPRSHPRELTVTAAEFGAFHRYARPGRSRAPECPQSTPEATIQKLCES